jgi:hypothetical protein
MRGGPSSRCLDANDNSFEDIFECPWRSNARAVLDMFHVKHVSQGAVTFDTFHVKPSMNRPFWSTIEFRETLNL